MWRKRQKKKKKKKNFRPRCFLVSVFDVYWTNVTNKVACKLKKNQPNIALKSGTVTKAYKRLKRSI